MSTHFAIKDLPPQPYELYSKLRSSNSFASIEGIFPHMKWSHIATRYEDVSALLRDPRFGSDVTLGGGFVNLKTARWVPKAFRSFLNSMILTDAPDHLRLRNLVSKGFTPRRVRDMEGKIVDIVDQLLDSIEGNETVDLMHDFSLQVPLSVISNMMGVPPEERERFHQLSVSFVDDLPGTYWGLARLAPTLIGLQRFFEKLVHLKRKHPADDLTTALIAVEDDGDRFSDDELVGMLFLLLMAGHETTINLVANGILALIEHPDQLAKFRQQPGLMDLMIEEMVRYTNPVQHIAPRFAKETVELNGKTIQKGESVMLFVAAANRDATVFDNPDVFDIARTPNKHLGFGFGAHYCLGAPLARMEASIAFSRLFERYPGIRLAVPSENLQWRKSIALNGLVKFPVHLR